MSKLTKGVLSNTFAQRAQFHEGGEVTFPGARTGQDVNPNAAPDATLDVTAPVPLPFGSDI